mgnify:FL=1
MAREDHPSSDGPEEEAQHHSPGDRDDLPEMDMRVVTLLVDVSDDESGDVQVDFAGAGYYEAIGMMVSALFQTLMAPFMEEMAGDD